MNDIERIKVDRLYSGILSADRGIGIVKMLDSLDEMEINRNKMWLNGLVYHPYSSFLKSLACWYMWLEDTQSDEIANESLTKYLGNPQVKTNFTVWVLGIKPDKTYNFDNITLSPILKMPESNARSEYLKLIQKHETPVSHAAFTTTVNLPRIMDNEKEASQVIRKLVHSTEDWLCEVTALVNGLNELSCLPHWKYGRQENDHPPGPWSTRSKSRTNFDITGNHCRSFTDEHAINLREMINGYKAFDEKRKKWIQVVLNRIQTSKRQQSLEGKILDLAIAAEMLLLKDLNERDPISFPFRYRGSWLLGKSYQERIAVHDLLKKFYSYRCAIAHDGIFKKEKDRKSASEVMPKLYEMVEEILSKSFHPSFPKESNDWLNLTLGEAF